MEKKGSLLNKLSLIGLIGIGTTTLAEPTTFKKGLETIGTYTGITTDKEPTTNYQLRETRQYHTKEDQKKERVRNTNKRLETRIQPTTNTTNIILKRTYHAEKPTMGELYHDKNNNGRIDEEDSKLADTLELAWKENKQYTSCIPEGTYEVTTREPTTNLKKPHFEIHNVPGRSYILIHQGKTRKNTQGCILVGKQKPKTYSLTQSTPTLKKLRTLLEEKKDIELHITSR